MTFSKQIKLMCSFCDISVTELAERMGITNQTLYDRLSREAFTPAKLAELARAAGCGYESVFTLADGQRIICALDTSADALMPSTSELVCTLCDSCGISKAELAKALAVSPQSFQNRLKRDTFRPRELKAIAAAVGCTYTSAFIMPNGDRITY